VDADVHGDREHHVLPAEHGRDLAVNARSRGKEVGVPSPKKKVTLYFSAAMLEETQREAIRQDRSISWIIQAAWRMSREEVRKLPSVAALSAPAAAESAAPPARLKAGN
jgi:uncharacterized small protein (TIGR04563 family)